MGLSFLKSVRILPGVRLNLSKTGPRLSAGFPGFRVCMDLSGRTQIRVGYGSLRYRKDANLGNLAALLQGRRNSIKTR